MEVTKEQIAEWKAKYGQVSRITVKDPENGDKVCYLKLPSRKALGYATQAAKDNPMKFNEVILQDCWLGGDDEIKTNDTLFLSVSSKIAELIEVKEAELEKL
ncbi:MAG: hypothetical protein NC038_05520 [Paludibacter sp.]|nr:hypothetical protein [Bacteroidales bacterium]MCM1069830.1 hypothetical protein [Prevotella sp.]MCM1353976.1 hypothetical protein [Bacteroides sp.]MCM1443382.1 hypothetical protein [Muribaculum sp.]MCM1482085.1 hypothetical protein [Paludibacter sp.]